MYNNDTPNGRRPEKILFHQGMQSERQQPTTKLRVTLLHVTQRLGQHLDGNLLVICKKMTLACISSIIDERVGVGRDSGDAGKDIAEELLGTVR